MAEQKKILIIDDDENLVAFLTALVEDNGYTAVSAYNGEEGISKVKSEQPDLILLDITMPEKTGVRFYRDVRENVSTSKIPVIMVTGVMEEFERFISTRRQVPPPDGYFSKPVDKDALLAKIAELLA